MADRILIESVEFPLNPRKKKFVWQIEWPDSPLTSLDVASSPDRLVSMDIDQISWI
jgi:hypothetical protein